MFGQEWYPEENPRGVVVLVHGLGEHSGRYSVLAESLINGGYGLIAYDQRGHGKSPGKRGHASSYEAMLQDIDLVIAQTENRFKGLPIFLYGHSLGGNLVVNYVLRFKPKLKGVVVTSPWLRLAFAPPASQVKLGELMEKFFPSFTLANGLELAALSHDAEIIDNYKLDELVHDRISARVFNGVYRAGLWALKKADEFSLPLLLMHGSGDRITSYEASREFAQGVSGDCTLKIWDGLYHELHNELEKTDIIHYIIAWLNSRS